MPEVFRKGAHVRGPDGSWSKLRTPVTVSACANSVNCRFIGAMFMVKPRGSPNIWKVYRVRSYIYDEPELVFKDPDEDVARAWMALTYGL